MLATTPYWGLSRPKMGRGSLPGLHLLYVPRMPVDDDSETKRDNTNENVADDAERDASFASIQYAITSFGADFDVAGVVERLRQGKILVPPFQRGYVWNLKEASRFIESLLLGLPVPGVFLAREKDTNKLLVIDGQQRLKTLQFYFDGFFNPQESESARKVFRLTDVQPPFAGLTYDKLPEKDRIRLNDSILHATIVKQDAPEDENTSVFHIFERLNSGGRRLAPQEIRTAMYHGPLIELLKKLNDYPAWRTIYGPPSPRLKDQELILRFFAFYFEAERYARPMIEFLSRFCARHRNLAPLFVADWQKTFTSATDAVLTALGERAFKPERALNAAVFDSVMVGVGHRLEKGPIKKPKVISVPYSKLLTDPDYLSAISRATADEKNVRARLEKATSAFADVA
jgi:hypothetical protein